MQERRIHTGPHGLDLSVLGWNTDAPGVPLLILHGFLEQALAWEEVAQALGRPVWAPDHRGHGRSEHVGAGGWYHFWDYVGDVDSVAEALFPERTFDLLGHSMGGTMAVLYAGTRPERIRRLVLVEGLGPPDSMEGQLSRARLFLRQRRDGLHHGAPLADLDAAAARMQRVNGALTDAHARRLAERQTHPVQGGLDWRWDARHRGRSPRAFDAGHFAIFLQAIQAPTLAIRGGRSRYPGFERAPLVSDITLRTIEQAGHLVHHDTPDLLAEAVRTHLDG